jgi:hypothetical protein
MTIEMTRTTTTKTTTELNDPNQIETVGDLPDDRRVFVVSHERRTNRDCCHLMRCSSLQVARRHETTTPRDTDDSTPVCGVCLRDIARRQEKTVGDLTRTTVWFGHGMETAHVSKTCSKLKDAPEAKIVSELCESVNVCPVCIDDPTPLVTASKADISVAIQSMRTERGLFRCHECHEITRHTDGECVECGSEGGIRYDE